MMQATGWQQHSVRGFLAGVVRKRLRLKLGSNKVDGARVYRVATAFHAPICLKPAITLSKKDWHSAAIGAVVSSIPGAEALRDPAPLA